jgi:hypothetical protein
MAAAANERQNFASIQRAIEAMGGVPFHRACAVSVVVVGSARVWLT